MSTTPGPAVCSLPDLTGTTIDSGRLMLVEILGRGGYGSVYRARDLTTGTAYAVKCMLQYQQGSRSDIFQKREIRAHTLLSSHPNVVSLHQTIYSSSYVFLVLDLINNGDLFAAVTRKRLYYRDDASIRRVFTQIIDAVEHCHKQGVYHRDLKPENILCSSSGDVYLADFGLCTHDEESKEFMCGSAFYMSPDCLVRDIPYIHGKPSAYCTAANDVWALGVILTNLISGRNPWRRAHASDECFMAYVLDRTYLSSVLPISEAANTLLQQIFVLDSSSRIGLKDLRAAVEKVDTFFLTRDELERVPEWLKSVDDEYAFVYPPETSVRAISEDKQLATEEDVQITAEARVVAEQLAAEEDVQITAEAQVVAEQVQAVLAYTSIGSSRWFSSSDSISSIFNDDSDCDTPSSADSTPPITPATLPDLLPDIQVPDELPALNALDISDDDPFKFTFVQHLYKLEQDMAVGTPFEADFDKTSNQGTLLSWLKSVAFGRDAV